MGPFTTKAGKSVRLLRRIAKGGSSEVYLAEDEDGRRYAFKWVPSVDPGRRERVLREAWLQRTLVHPGIVVVRDLVDIPSGIGLLADFVDGPPAYALLRRETPPHEEATWLFGQVVDAVAAAHEAGVVHRDLKPGNILFRAGLQVDALITDFGIARVEGSDITLDTITLGTPGYMAPEQYLGAASVDARADVYALGCLAYQFLTGRRTFPAEDPQAARLRSLRGDHAEMPPAWPARLRDLVESMLSVRAQDRPNNATEVASYLAPFVPERPPGGVREAGLTWAIVHRLRPTRQLARLRKGEEAQTGPGKPHIPTLAMALVGRDHEYQQVVKAIIDERRLTIVGLPGVGKTALALAVAHEVLRQFPGHVLYVDLHDSDLPPEQRIADSLGVDPSRDSVWDLPQLRSANLLVLDGVDQASDLDHLPIPDGLAVLVTARHTPSDDRRILTLLPLSTRLGEERGPRRSDAADLLARAMHPKPPPSERELERVAELSGGHPATLLAAAERLTRATPRRVLAELADPSVRRGPLRAIVGWIDRPDESWLSAVLVTSVFAAPPRPDDIASVLGLETTQTWELLDRAAQLGVVRFEVLGGTSRVLPLAPIAAEVPGMAQDHGDWSLWTQRHANLVVGRILDEYDVGTCAVLLADLLVAARRHPETHDLDQALLLSAEVVPGQRAQVPLYQAAVRSLAQELPAEQAAWWWIVLGEIGLRTANFDLAYEAERHLPPTLSRPVQAAANTIRGWLERASGDPEEAEKLLTSAVEQGTPEVKSRALRRLAQLHSARGRPRRALSFLVRALDAAKEIPFGVEGAKVRALLATAQLRDAPTRGAVLELTTAAQAFRQAGLNSDEGWARLHAAEAAAEVGDLATARSQLDRASLPVSLAQDPELSRHKAVATATVLLAEQQPATALLTLEGDLANAPHVHPVTEASNLRLQGQALAALGDLGAAITQFQSALDVIAPYDEPATRAALFIDLSWATLAAGAVRRAEDYATHAVADLRDVDWRAGRALVQAWNDVHGYMRERVPIDDEQVQRLLAVWTRPASLPEPMFASRMAWVTGPKTDKATSRQRPMRRRKPVRPLAEKDATN